MNSTASGKGRAGVVHWAVVATILLVTRLAAADESRFAPIAERMQAFVNEHQASGIVTLVAHKGRIVDLSVVGLADLESRQPMTASTQFRVMSMTKPITATAVMILVDEGKLSIEDAVEKYIPAFAEAKTEGGEAVRGLKVRHLLTHTSGLVGKQGCEKSLANTAEMLAVRPFGFQPGTKWEYGPSLNVCGRIIEVVSGQPYDEFVAERILKPLGMSDTTFSPTAEQQRRTAVVYEQREDKKSLVPARELVIDPVREEVPNPSGGLLSTATDMYRFYQMVLNEGELDGHRVLSQEAVRAMTALQTGDLATGFTPGNGWGLGWCIVRRPAGVSAMFSPGTFGHGGKYGTQGWIDPAQQTILVLMLQRNDMENSDGSEIRREFQRLAVAALNE